MHPQVANGASGIAEKSQQQPLPSKILEGDGFAKGIFGAKSWGGGSSLG